MGTHKPRWFNPTLRVGTKKVDFAWYNWDVSGFLMTATPLFVPTTPPQAERNATLNYPAGSITMARGNFAALFADAAFLSSCAVVSTQRSRKSYVRTDYIGAPVRSVDASDWEEIKYPSQTKSIAAGGEAIQIKIQGEWWTARLSGTHYAFMTFLCGAKESLIGTVSWRSERGTLYGPVANPSYPGDD